MTFQIKMAPQVSFLALLLAAVLVTAWIPASKAPHINKWRVAALGREDDGIIPSQVSNGQVGGECIDNKQEEEVMAMAMETGSNRRRSLAAARRFISYGALTQNRVPCNRRGQSYYNCRRQRRVNPYRRGCSIITRCARILQ